jgi:hypothetical protein
LNHLLTNLHDFAVILLMIEDVPIQLMSNHRGGTGFSTDKHRHTIIVSATHMR